MLPFCLIACSALFGVIGASPLYAVICGILLACIASVGRRALWASIVSGRQFALFNLAIGASVIIGQATSIGAFASGRAIAAMVS